MYNWSSSCKPETNTTEINSTPTEKKIKLAKTKQSKQWRMKKCCRFVAAFGNNNRKTRADGHLIFTSPEGL